MYSIGKGSVIYCMSREYNEKEVRFLPRCKNNINYIDTNFGEIEMCIGLPIKYSIKMKSKVVELYSLKKIDFVRLTIVFKEFMESFLEKALILYKEFKRNYHKIINEKKEMHNRLLQKMESNDNIKIKKLLAKNHRKISYSKSVFIRAQEADDEGSDDEQLVKAFLQRRASIEFKSSTICGQIDDLSSSLERNKFKYTLEVYNRVNELFKEVKKESKPKKRLELLEEIEQLLISNVNDQLEDTNSL